MSTATEHGDAALRMRSSVRPVAWRCAVAAGHSWRGGDPVLAGLENPYLR
jgi:hypothetical protein